MIRRSTWITLMIALLLGGAAYGARLYKTQQAQTHPTPSATPNDLFTFTGDDVVEVEVQTAAQPLILRRESPQADWQVVQPAPQGNEIPDQERISTAIFNLTTLSAHGQVPSGTDLTTLGLLSPAYVVTVRLKDGKTWKVEIGNETPIGSGYYARFNGRLLIVDKYAVDSLLGLLSKPPLITPMPTSTPTPPVTATPPPTATP